ncbi:DNA polymerase III subunit chi [Thioalkalivibrio sp. AKL19]|uniref:DNA polymerase III subunit chi n=1 Tax=Thioalkalivibrio sp. AKL19 TaxID=1266914 RepID=UPI0003FF1894|nr:DNA polymerase III subunit chi [Thioalkalivibrio sp. AKL19]
MTHVSFYLLKDPAPEARLRFACRLAKKASGQGHRVHIHTGSLELTRTLDEWLWTFEDTAFLPHSTDVRDTDVPVSLHEAHAPSDRCDVLINLAPDVPEYCGRFERVADIVGGEEPEREAGRARYRFFKERGYPLEHHNIQ